jgi:hypothetical protein
MRARQLMLVSCVMTLAAWSAPAQGQSLGRLLACADIPRAEERLQCYDAAARTAIGIAPATAVQRLESPGSSAALEERARDLEMRELKVRAQELELSKKMKAAKGGVAAAAAVPVAEQGGAALAQREAALAQREAELKAREAKLNAGKMSVEEEATLFGIPIPFTKKDSFNQSAELPNQTVEKSHDGIVDAITVGIADYTYNADERLTLVLENGQVWRQIEGDRINLSANPETPHKVRISRGAMGSFNLKVNEMNRTVKVRRIDGQTRKR